MINTEGVYMKNTFKNEKFLVKLNMATQVLKNLAEEKLYIYKSSKMPCERNLRP